MTLFRVDVAAWQLDHGGLVLREMAGRAGVAVLPDGAGTLLVEAVDHCAGHVGVHLDDYGGLPSWINEGGDRAGLVHAAVAEPLPHRLLQVAGEPERSPVVVAEVPHGDLPRSDRLGGWGRSWSCVGLYAGGG